MTGRWGKTFAVPDGVRAEMTRPMIAFPDGKIDKARIYICEKADCWTVSTQEQRGYVDLSITEYRMRKEMIIQIENFL